MDIKYVIYLTALLISMFVTIALMPILKGLAVQMNFVDMPDARKVHKQPIPKIGGVAMAFGVVIPVMLWLDFYPFVTALMTGSAIIVFFGFIDDVKNLSYKGKLLGQIAAGLCIIMLGGVRIQTMGSFMPFETVLPDFVAVPLTLLTIVGVTNAINLSDGLDGLAGGISILIFICIGYLAYRSDDMILTFLSVAVIGSIFGFLRFNTHPATVFMGDTGSQLLGYLAIVFSIKVTQAPSPYSPALPLIMLGFPILDTLVVMIERISKGRSPFVADKNHFHHKLMRRGLLHSEAVFVIYVLQAILISSAYLFRFYSEGWLLLLYFCFSGTIVSVFFITEHYNWEVKKYDLFNHQIRKYTGIIKNKNYTIRIFFPLLKYGLPLLLFATVFAPEKMPNYFIFLVFVFALMVLWTKLFFKSQRMGGAIRIGLYMVTPFLVYLSVHYETGWASQSLSALYNAAFILITAAIFLTLKFTRRRKGFKATPMDFLILFIALVVPNLPEDEIVSQSYGIIAVRVIIFLFGYEVLLGELRGEFDMIGMLTIITFLVLFVRGASMYIF